MSVCKILKLIKYFHVHLKWDILILKESNKNCVKYNDDIVLHWQLMNHTQSYIDKSIPLKQENCLFKEVHKF